jgi:hypothetical protein
MADITKLKQAILYLSQLSENDPKFGAVKLNKILYYADFRAYLELGHSVTGATYQHLEEGPAPRELLPARDELQSEGAIRLEDRPVFTRIQQRTVAQREPNLTVFDSREIEILRDAFEFLLPYWGYQASILSHLEWGWKLTTEGEDIPYVTAWLSSEPLTQEQIRVGQALWEHRSA